MSKQKPASEAVAKEVQATERGERVYEGVKPPGYFEERDSGASLSGAVQGRGQRSKPAAPPPPLPLEQVPVLQEALAADAAFAGELPRWRVRLNCPTPLRDKDLIVPAATEGEARAKFLAHNGISGSEHDWTIEKVP